MSNSVLPWWSDLWCMNQTIPFSLDTATLSALEILNKLVLAVDGLISDGKLTAEQIAELQRQVQTLDSQLSELIKKLDSGDLIPNYIDALRNWIDSNLINLVGRIVKFVWFGLSDDGHFCAYIPTSWRFLKFDMIADPDSPDYGRLLLSY